MACWCGTQTARVPGTPSPFLSGAPESHLELKAPERWFAKQDQVLKVRVTNLPRETQVRLRYHWGVLDAKPSDQGEFELDTDRLGRGLVRLQPVACDAQGKVLYCGLPVKIYIENQIRVVVIPSTCGPDNVTSIQAPCVPISLKHARINPASRIHSSQSRCSPSPAAPPAPHVPGT